MSGQRTSFRILVVDDVPDILNPLKRGLELRNFKVDAFTDPLKALSAFEAGKYDLALLDVNMPNMNGFQLFHELTKKDPALKVCFLTAYEHFENGFRNEFPEISIDCLLRKPMSIAEIAVQIRKLLSR